jgi:glycosyltransferase involved in cell wall biosynthesis
MTRVSIITPCHEAGQFIDELLDSVAAQTMRDWEHIVVDDGSPDDSASRVDGRLEREPRLRLIQQANAGAIAARNRGFAASDPTAEFVLFLDADDVLKPQMLEELVDYLDSHSGVAMVFCEPEWIDAQGNPTVYGSPGTRYVPTRFGVKTLPRDDPAMPFEALFFWGRVSPSISLLRRHPYVEAGGFLEDQGYYAEDLDLYLRIALRGVINYLPERLVLRRIHPLNHGSRANAKAQEQRLYKRWLDAGWLTADEQRFVRKTWRLRQARLLPRLWRMWGSEHLRRGELPAAMTCYLKSGKRVASYAGARLLGRLPAGPVW